MMEKGLSRRNFLAGAAADIVGVAGAGMLASCGTPQKADEGQSADSGQAEAAALKEPTSTRDADIIIVGSGAAGCLAAYEAAKLGVDKVLVATKSGNATNSNFNAITGTYAVETEGTKSIGQDYSLVDMYQRMISFAHWTVNAKLLRDCVMLLPENITILQEMGAETAILGDRYNAGFTCVHGFVTTDKGIPVEQALTGMGVELLYDAPATHILMQDDKAVGIQCEQGKDVINVNAKAVLVCTGSYMANEEMLKQVYGNVTLCNMGSEKNTGDGQRMVLEAGGVEDRIHGLGMNDIYGMNAKSTISVFSMRIPSCSSPSMAVCWSTPTASAS